MDTPRMDPLNCLFQYTLEFSSNMIYKNELTIAFWSHKNVTLNFVRLIDDSRIETKLMTEGLFKHVLHVLVKRPF